MNFLSATILALALCVDSLVVSTTSAFKSKMNYSKGMLLATILALFQGGFPLIGALIGEAFRDLIDSVDHWVAFGLLFMVGLKMIIDAFHDNDDGKQMDVTNIGVMCILGIATSIDAFVVGIGLGLNTTSLSEIILTILDITVVTFAVSLIGVFLGKRNIPIPERWATILAGLVLIGLGTATLLEHLMS